MIAGLGHMGWNITAFAERTIVLFKAMEACFIRARGHDSFTTFELRVSWEQAIRGAQRFMSENLGPDMTCRFNDLRSGQTIEFVYGRFSDRLDAHNLSFLLSPGCGSSSFRRYLPPSGCPTSPARAGSVGHCPPTLTHKPSWS
jgi:hypothetical protein